MNKTFSMFFFLRRKSKDSESLSPIYLRITLDGYQSELSTKRSIQNSRWDIHAQKALGKTDESKNLNYYLQKPLKLTTLGRSKLTTGFAGEVF